MHVLVTGGTGFIGRALCSQLLSAGHAVTVLTRNPTVSPAQGVRLVSQLQAVQGIDAVINLAGEPLADGRWSAVRKSLFRDSRLGTTRQLLDWMATQSLPPRVLLSGSAIGYYGPHGDDRPLTESSPPANDFAAQLCRDWEAEALQAEALGVRVCIVRIGIVLGADGGALGRMLLPFRLGFGGPMGHGRQWMSWVQREDLVRLMLWLLSHDTASGVYNGTSPVPVTNREFTRTLAAVLRRPALLPMPAFVLRLMLGEMADALLLSGQRVLPARAEAQGFAFRYRELQPALRALLG